MPRFEFEQVSIYQYKYTSEAFGECQSVWDCCPVPDLNCHMYCDNEGHYRISPAPKTDPGNFQICYHTKPGQDGIILDYVVLLFFCTFHRLKS